jgi:enoyl-CoA hydratase/carnithine racemase
MGMFGGAFEMALACDITVAGESALLGEPEVRFGSEIVALLLPWIAGPKQAKEILLTGEDRLPAHLFSPGLCWSELINSYGVRPLRVLSRLAKL